MLGRQKVLLYLISAAKERGKNVTKTFVDKALFVLGTEYPIRESVKFYNFYPHSYGPFSNAYYHDLGDLQSRGYIDGELGPLPMAEAAGTADPKVRGMVDDVLGRFDSDTIVGYVYDKYPGYTSRSRLVEQKRAALPPGIFSIGYEKKDIDLFLNLLIQNSIDLVVDVRANPFSMNFSFVKSRLESSLEKAGIGYLHIPELGIGGEKRKNLETDEDYAALFNEYSREALPRQAEQVGRLLKLGQTRRIALLCFEADQRRCHRGVVSKKLEEVGGLRVTHL